MLRYSWLTLFDTTLLDFFKSVLEQQSMISHTCIQNFNIILFHKVLQNSTDLNYLMTEQAGHSLKMHSVQLGLQFVKQN